MAKKARGIDGAVVLARKLRDPEFRAEYEQRRLIHEIALKVRGMRLAAGLSQQDLARKIGTSQPAIARLERGQGPHTPQWETLRRIAIALGKQLRIKFADDQGELVEVEGALLEEDARA
jgi:transcriptional regulator with XRE-family HTH domain